MTALGSEGETGTEGPCYLLVFHLGADLYSKQLLRNFSRDVSQPTRGQLLLLPVNLLFVLTVHTTGVKWWIKIRISDTGVLTQMEKKSFKIRIHSRCCKEGGRGTHSGPEPRTNTRKISTSDHAEVQSRRVQHSAAATPA